MIKCKRAGCLSVLVSLKKKQHNKTTHLLYIIFTQLIFMKGLAAVFSLGSLVCEFQIFYILLSVGESNTTLLSKKLIEQSHFRAFQDTAPGANNHFFQGYLLA